MNKKVKEWCIKAPWGKIALVSWGNPRNPPILLVHGYMDTAATFTFLVEHLPDNYCYVGFDMPGHGKSDTFPQGLIITQLHIVEVIRRIVVHMKWKRFVYMAHSMGCVIGLFYHHIYPDCIKKMILLDPIPPIAVYQFAETKPDLWFKFIYTEYYENYKKWNSDKLRLHTYDSAISLVVRNRSLTEEQAEVVLARSLVPMGIDSYKLSWEQRMKKIAQVPIPEETLYTVMTTKSPPTLSIDASDQGGGSITRESAENLVKKCEQTLPHFYRATVNGGHDFHITNPELTAALVKNFLKSNETNFDDKFAKSKL